ncbi:hypothetical protein FS837_008364 [Tulasnella sp. UAMH 9824]|nr:hypothetical protein FS837_008364 [Tulasnella sp. UAMH 9824]
MDDEAFDPKAIRGLGLDTVLAALELPSSASLGNQLGLSGLDFYTSSRLFAGFPEEGAIGVGEGDDYEDEVDMEIKKEEEDVDMGTMSPLRPVVATATPSDEDEDDLFGPEPPRKRRKKSKTARKAIAERPKDVGELFPTFEPGKVLDFTELFKGRAIKKSRVKVRPYNVQPVAPKERELVDPRPIKSLIGDAKAVVQQSKASAAEPAVDPNTVLLRVIDSQKQRNDTQQNPPLSETLPVDERSYDLVLLADWEKDILFDPPASTSTALTAPNLLEPNAAMSLSNPHNLYLESNDWLQTIIWDIRRPFKDFRQLPFDPEPIPKETLPPPVKAPEAPRPRRRVRIDLTVPQDKFNLSNDQYYEVSKEKSRVRQTFGQLIVEHAYPAQKLQLPFYKTRLSKQEARSWHRPALQFPINLPLSFNKVRGAKKKKDKAGRKITRGDLTEGLRFTGDISLRDTSSFVLFEYSEEYPPTLSSFGMGSVLVNYYRKRNDADEYIPKLDLGEPFILEPNDESPFMRHGHVPQGDTVQAVYNNLYRAPLFRHKPASTDFLVIRSSTKGESRYFIREIKNLFVVGQTFPVVEVPGPHSRKITNTIKGRLQVIAFRLLGKSKEGRIKIQRLLKYFPDENELQMKQRLKPFIKEFMEFHRTGPHQNYWRTKTTIKQPTKAEMLRIVEPEHVVLSEAMTVGSQHLMDSGYGKGDFADGEKDEEDTNKMSIEQQLAPWMTTKSFVSAATKGTLMKLHGDGDPTTRGEAFSFIRASAKTPFVKAGEDPDVVNEQIASKTKNQHKYTVADQQQAYRQEVDRIWKAQHDSLSNPIPPVLTEEDETHPSQSISRRGSLQPGARGRSPSIGFSDRAPSRAGSVGYGGQHDNASLDGRDPMSNRVLRIRRLIDGKWKTEIIRDPRVITAYVERKRIDEEAAINPENLVVTGDSAIDARNAKRIQDEIARLKKNQGRRLQRKQKAGEHIPAGEYYTQSETTRKCGNCGQIGHMKTNRKCPRWAEFHADGGPITAASPPPATAASPPPGGSAMSPPAASAYFAPGSAFRNAAFAVPPVPSPLATSPPFSAQQGWQDEGAMSPDAGGSTAKKITLKVRK